MDQSQPNNRQPLRVGLLVDSVVASHYIYDFVTWAARHPNVIVTHLVVHPSADSANRPGTISAVFRRLKLLLSVASRRGLYFVFSELLFRAVIAFERRLIARNSQHANFVREYDLSSLVKHVIHIAPIVSKSGLVYRFHASDVDRVRSLDLHLLVRCGGRILRGDILKASRLGVLSFHHADNRINRGGPAGFWEVYYRQGTTGFTLQRLTDDLDAGDVLMRGHFGTRHYYLLNKAFLFEKSNYYLKALVEEIALLGRLPDVMPRFPYTHILYRNPRALETLVYFSRFLYSAFCKRLMKLTGIINRWNVAFVVRNWREAEYWRRIEIENPAFRYLADPFVIEREGRHFCLMEELDCRTRRGSIVAYEIGREGAFRIGTALKEEFHLSFPYLFEYEGGLYMCPECSETKSIRIYRCIEFPLRWRLETIAMRNVSAADTMIFESGGKWWMFTNIDTANVGDHCSELFIFWAPTPLSSDWTPHPLNPVIVDASRARNAGLLRDGDQYFRCSQQQAFDFYGRQLQINEIVELTDTKFVERCVSVVTPSFGEDIIGTHHLHGVRNITVFDFLTISHPRSGAKI